MINDTSGFISTCTLMIFSERSEVTIYRLAINLLKQCPAFPPTTMTNDANPQTYWYNPGGGGYIALTHACCGRLKVRAPDRTNTQGLKITEENVLP